MDMGITRAATRAIRLGLLALTLAGAPAIAGGPPKAPIDRILGFKLGDPEAKVRPRLGHLGERFTRGHGELAMRPNAEQEIWVLHDPHYSFLLVRWDLQRRLDLVQVWIRQTHHSLRYGDLGDLAQAKKLGNFIWVWNVPSRDDEPMRRVEARGTDSLLVDEYSIMKLSPGETPSRPD
jgi:hypothetical protein